ncbi:MAG: hypothetical protein CTY33_10015 [Methylotenera sp.]|nr:MAG: hypothetical protein CTY33_10015 [Methylotenera sp.]
MDKKDKNINKRGLLILAAGLSLISTLSSAAEPPKDLQPLEDIPPPPMSKEGEDVDEPQVTIVKKGGDTIEEYRINGQLYMMKVTPKSGVPYYLHKEDQDGGWINDGPNKPLIIPKWTIFRF